MILYLIYGFGMVTCTVSPLSRFTAHLLTNERVGVFLARRSVQHLVLTNKIHCFRFKVKSYDLFESTYNTNLILPLPLSMPEFLKRKMKCLICVDFFFPRQLLRLPQWNLCHWNQTGVRNFLPHRH